MCTTLAQCLNAGEKPSSLPRLFPIRGIARHDRPSRAVESCFGLHAYFGLNVGPGGGNPWGLAWLRIPLPESVGSWGQAGRLPRRAGESFVTMLSQFRAPKENRCEPCRRRPSPPEERRQRRGPEAGSAGGAETHVGGSKAGLVCDLRRRLIRPHFRHGEAREGPGPVEPSADECTTP